MYICIFYTLLNNVWTLGLFKLEDLKCLWHADKSLEFWLSWVTRLSLAYSARSLFVSLVCLNASMAFPTLTWTIVVKWSECLTMYHGSTSCQDDQLGLSPKWADLNVTQFVCFPDRVQCFSLDTGFIQYAMLPNIYCHQQLLLPVYIFWCENPPPVHLFHIDSHKFIVAKIITWSQMFCCKFVYFMPKFSHSCFS